MTFPRLRKNETANVSILTAICFLPMCAVCGLAVDFDHTSKRKAKVQAVLDASVLAAAKVKQSGATDPITGEKGFADWSFDVIKKASYMLSHGAELIVTAEDAFNPSVDPDYPQSVFPLPGPGMFASMFRKLMFPRGEDKIRVCGKGGVEGDEFMIGRALEMLREQGHNGDLSSVMIIGDRFDTDVRAGVRAGLRTCLVESGCHAELRA